MSKTAWRSLTGISLSDNEFGDEGCEHLSRAQWPKLRTLNLDKTSYNCHRISIQGCRHLGKLSANFKLKKISLGLVRKCFFKKIKPILNWFNCSIIKIISHISYFVYFESRLILLLLKTKMIVFWNENRRKNCIYLNRKIWHSFGSNKIGNKTCK